MQPLSAPNEGVNIHCNAEHLSYVIPINVNGSPIAKSPSIVLKIYPLVFADGTKGLSDIATEEVEGGKNPQC